MRRPGARLEYVDDELIEVCAGEDLVTGRDDGSAELGREAPESAFASAAAFFTRTVARMNAGNGLRPEIGKFSTARAVWAP